VLLLHAIGPAESGAPPASGLRPAWPLRALTAVDLTAWASLVDPPPGRHEGLARPALVDVRPRLGRDDLLAHHRLAEQALAAGVCLPARFPTWLADEAALRELLERRRADLLAAIQRVRGRVELAVTVTWNTQLAASPSPEVATSPGTRFLEERRRHYARADQRRAEAERLAQLVAADDRIVEAMHNLCPSDEIGLSSAVLVRHADAGAVRQRLQSLQEGVRILVSGPWPPYSFVSLEED
jgi:hypothetical protein